jgi:hypothetical protein
MNNLLHDVSLYMVSRSCPQYYALCIVAPQYVPSSGAPLICFVSSDIFDSDLGTMRKRSPENPIDPPNYGMSFREGKARFNQFETMEGVVSGSKFLNNPGPFPKDGWEPVLQEKRQSLTMFFTAFSVV